VDVLPADDLFRPHAGLIQALRANVPLHHAGSDNTLHSRAQIKNVLRFFRTALGKASGTRQTNLGDVLVPPF
jgi:hypothetical protein